MKAKPSPKAHFDPITEPLGALVLQISRSTEAKQYYNKKYHSFIHGSIAKDLPVLQKYTLWDYKMENRSDHPYTNIKQISYAMKNGLSRS